MNDFMPRQEEPEAMDLAEEARAYAEADFADVNAVFVERLLYLTEQVPAHARAVDLGCGPGDISLRVGRARPQWQVAAGDISMSMLAFAASSARRDPLRPHVWPVCQDAKRMPWPDAGFDVIFSNSLLHHLPETEGFWREVRRIAAPGAWVFLRDLARPATEAAARMIVKCYAGNESELLQEEYYRSLLAAFTPDEVRGQLRAAGLDGLAVEMASDRHLDIFGRVTA